MRCNRDWEERFRPEVKRFYFLAKENGVAPSYHMQTPEELEAARTVKEAGQQRRDERFQIAKDEHERRLMRENGNYGDLRYRMLMVEVKESERVVRRKLLQDARHQHLVEVVTRHASNASQSAAEDVAKREEAKMEEMARLKEYLVTRKSRQWSISDTEFSGLKKRPEQLLLTRASVKSSIGR